MDISVRQVMAILVAAILLLVPNARAQDSDLFGDLGEGGASRDIDFGEGPSTTVDTQEDNLDDGLLRPVRPGEGEETKRSPRPGSPPTPPPGTPFEPLPPGTIVVEDGGIVSAEEPLPVFSSGTWLFSGCWYAQQDVVMLQKSKPRQAILAVNNSPASLFTTTDAVHGFEPGASIRLGRMFGRDKANRDRMLEFRFFGLADWTARADTVAAVAGAIDTNITQGVPLPGFTGADAQTYIYKSELDSYELNVRLRSRPNRDRMVLQPNSGTWERHGTASRLNSIFGGVVFMKVDEDFLYSSLAADPATDPRDYRTNTFNNMVGIQFGGELFNQYDNFSWGFRGRIGGLINYVQRRSRLDDAAGNSVIFPEENIFDEKLTFLGEVGLFGAYQIHPNLALRIAYDAMYLEGIALAPENIGISSGSGFPLLNLSGNAWYTGLSLGLEMVW